jgi:hypothetical protein
MRRGRPGRRPPGPQDLWSRRRTSDSLRVVEDQGRASRRARSARGLCLRPGISEAFSAILRDRADQLVSRVITVATRDVPEAVPDEGLRREISAAGRLIVTAIIRQLAEGRVGPPDVDPRASELPRTFARQGLDVSVQLTVYRAGQDAFWAEVLMCAQAREDLEQRLAVLVILWERFSAWVSSYIDVQIGLPARTRTVAARNPSTSERDPAGHSRRWQRGHSRCESCSRVRTERYACRQAEVGEHDPQPHTVAAPTRRPR